jgi:hypothetical protein
MGCYTDAASPRTLNPYYAIVDANTNVGCQATCSGLGYTYAGTEYGSEVNAPSHSLRRQV